MLDRQKNRSLKTLGLLIALGLIVVSVLIGYWSFTISDTDDSLQWWINWLQDLGTEMLGAAVTILLVELVIYEKRDEASRLDRERMRRRDQFTDRLKRSPTLESRQKILERMKQQNLLAGAWLYEVDLQQSDLSSIDLQDIDLYEAKLQGANLSHSNLENAVLRKANLQGALLKEADLQGADLQETNLCGADLQGAILKDAVLYRVRFDEHTILPDGTHWQPEVDVTKLAHPSESKLLDAASLLPLTDS